MAAGEFERGAEMMQQAVSEYRAIGGGILLTHGFALLAGGLLKAGRDDEAIATVDEAIQHARISGEVHFEPELHRIRGLALLERARKAGGEGLDAAQAALEHAVELAHGQKAYWLELRAATWLARLLHARGESARARQILAPAHARIAEGHEQREMIEASTLLAELI
jgi:predicted ATPase